jgi:hypothetical protein
MERPKVKRPNPFQWVWYAFGGGLPERNRSWVLHDVTAKTRFFRHLLRSMVLISPLVVFWLFVPGPLGLRLSLVLMGLIVGLFYSFCYLEESAEHRLAKAGYSRDRAKEVLGARRAERDAEIKARYIATYRS